MRIDELLTRETDIEEWRASKELCKNRQRSDKSLGASALSSCKSQGYRTRDSKVKARYGGSQSRRPIKGKVRGKKYGGSLPDYS
jgi:hypothetical protein